MKTRTLSFLAALCLASVLALSSSVSATEHAIPAGDSYSVEVEMSIWEPFTYSWSSDVPLTFTVEDPLGNEVPYQTGATSGSGILPAYASGTYTLTWTNNGLTLAHLSFDLSGAFAEVEEGLSILMWTVVIAVIVVVAVVVIVVIVVVMGGKKAPPQPVMGPQPQMAAQALATGHCPTCGNPIDPNAMFCQKCGTRYR
jgi:hypothetical protein